MARFPFAWYGVAAGTAKKGTLSGSSIAVQDATVTATNVFFEVTIGAGQDTISNILMTNVAGRSYVRSGDHYDEIEAPAYVSGLHYADRQFKVDYTVSMYKGDHAELSLADLASIADTYTVTVTPSSLTKISLNEATALGTKGANPAADTAAVSNGGALAATAGSSVGIFTIVVGQDGSITIDSVGKTAAEALAGVSKSLYGGLDVNSQEAQDYGTISGAYNESLTVSVAGATAGALS